MVYGKTLAIPTSDQLVYGDAPRPLHTRHGLYIGGGSVYPEINFTLPEMSIDATTWPKVIAHYRQIIDGVLARAVDLQAPGLVVEFESLPPMTADHRWAVEITALLADRMEHYHREYGLRSALRLTPNDNREMERPPVMRSGPYLEEMLKTFDKGAAAGAELLSIESVGGKEVHDDALLMGDIAQVIFALCVMGVRDMRFLWTHIAAIASERGVHAAGDTACGFGNTAMVLAEKRMIPKVFAAVVRPITAVRSLVAYECGAVGPGKDCGYENPILKAITGFPMSMEGKMATCAHLSPLGNIPAATCDLWSNESVQNIKLLGDMAPVCSFEQLEYDCRLMNRAALDGDRGRTQLRDWLVSADANLDPQAFILTPENCVAFAKTIVEAPDHYTAGRNVAAKALAILRQAVADDELVVPEQEVRYLDLMEASIETMPDSESEFIDAVMPMLDTSRFRPEEYDLV